MRAVRFTRAGRLRKSVLIGAIRGLEYRCKRSALRGESAQRRHCSQMLTKFRRLGFLTPNFGKVLP